MENGSCWLTNVQLIMHPTPLRVSARQVFGTPEKMNVEVHRSSSIAVITLLADITKVHTRPECNYWSEKEREHLATSS